VANAETAECYLENAYILINEKKLSNLKDMLPLVVSTN
jgi:chaperonin GroEL